jgi:hypothetical protein
MSTVAARVARQSSVCNGTCAEPSCADGAQNGDETDLDCGGSCDGCVVGQACAVEGDCATGNCTPEAICGEGFRRVFVTSQLTSGVLGGLAGGDALCQQLADQAGLGGTYFAWLSTNVESPSSRFSQSTQPYVLVDGTVVATDYADLIDGTLNVPINMTEVGGSQPPTDPICSGATDWVHTGTSSNGMPSGTANCIGWTDAAAPGAWGKTTESNSSWSTSCSGGNAAAALCGMRGSLYCFEQ